MLDGQPAHGNVAGSYQYSQTGFKIDFGPYSDSLRPGYCPLTEHKLVKIRELYCVHSCMSHCLTCSFGLTWSWTVVENMLINLINHSDIETDYWHRETK